jgi:death on curing protein
MNEGSVFLDLDDIIEIHRFSIEHYGGDEGLRDLAALESAIHQPQATFGGKLLHDDLWSQAAAYLFHLAKNHPFVDGNKRVATASALIFLRMNGFTMEVDEDELSAFVFGVVADQYSKVAIAAFLRQHSDI